MGVRIVRQSSDTPNVNNIDDIIPMRYAYGNQDGYTIGVGSELSADYENGTFTVNSGRAVIQGTEIVIDANGLSTTLDTGLETRYFKIYLKTNLDSDIAELENYYSTVSYDDIPEPASGEVISGNTAYLLLYTLKLNGAVEAEKTKVVRQIDYNHRRLLWTGNAEIGTTNPSGTIQAFAKVKEKENVMYEVQGEITDSGGTRRTFVVFIRVNEPNQYGYSAEQIVGTWMTSSLMQFTTVKIERDGDFFYGRAMRPTLYFSSHNLVNVEITASVNRIYEIN